MILKAYSMTTTAFGVVAVLASTISCGGSEGEETKTTSDQTSDTDTTDGDSDESDTSSDDTSSGPVDTTDTETPQNPDPDELPDPVLPDVPSDTPLSELDDDELEQVCEAYVETAELMVAKLPDLCPLLGVNAGLSAMTTDQSMLRAACSVGFDECADDVTTAEASVGTLTCGPASDCTATIGQFNACNRQVAAVNQWLLDPLIELDAPSCEEVTSASATSLQISAGITLIGGNARVVAEAGGLPSDADSPCAELQQECPDFAAPFTSLQGVFTL